jgi:hypothetical protein
MDSVAKGSVAVSYVVQFICTVAPKVTDDKDLLAIRSIWVAIQVNFSRPGTSRDIGEVDHESRLDTGVEDFL